jgi:hypothetical protein
MRMTRPATFLTALAFASLGTVVSAPSATAGTNGQQIAIDSSYCWYAEIRGTSYAGDPNADYGPFYLPNYHNPVPNYWWVGTTTILCWDSNGTYRGAGQTTVPKSQSSDWWNVRVEPAADGNAARVGSAFLQETVGDTGGGGVLPPGLLMVSLLRSEEHAG